MKENELYKYISDRIKTYREEHNGKGISQEDLAVIIGVSPNTISRWETGIYKPKVDDLQKLAKFFGKPLYTFFPEDQQPKNDQFGALYSAIADLKKEDISAITEFAEFRRARQIIDKKKNS